MTDRDKRTHDADPLDDDSARRTRPLPVDEEDSAANPPRTTTGKVTSPKFGSAGSGGAELEPGPKRN
jgi:hypothetical protein